MPKRYVDLDEALNLFDADTNFYDGDGNAIGRLTHLEALQKTVKDKLLSLPLADVVEVVRCRDCTLCEEHVQKCFDGSEDTWYICWRTRGYSLDGDGYCNHGIKKMTEEEYRCGSKNVTSAAKKNGE